MKRPWVTALGCVVFVGNLLSLMFWWWIRAVPAHAVGPNQQPIDTYDAISLEITTLGVLLAAMAIGLGIAAVFGYSALRDHMLMRVDEQINQRFQGKLSAGETANGLSPRGPAAPVAGYTEITEG